MTEEQITGKLEEKSEKSSQNGATYYSLKIGGKYMSAFGEASRAIKEVPLNTLLDVTYTVTSKNGKNYNNLQAFKTSTGTERSNNNREEKDENIAKSVAANVTAELAKSSPDEVEKLGTIGFFLTVAPIVFQWLRSDGSGPHKPAMIKAPPTTDHLEATEDSFQSP